MYFIKHKFNDKANGWSGRLYLLLSAMLSVRSGEMKLIGWLAILMVSGCGRPPSLHSSRHGTEEIQWLSRYELLERIKIYQSHVNEAEAAVLRLRAQNRQVQRYLLGGRDQGCFLQRKLGALTIRVTGHQEESPLLMYHHHHNHLVSTGDPHLLHFEFAPDLGVSIPGRELIKTGVAQTFQLKNYQIDDLSYLKITKSGKGIRSQANYTKRGCGFLWLAPCERYSFFESGRWRIQQLEVWSDQLLVYRKILGHTFKAASPEWQDNQLLQNRTYQELAGRDDCHVAQYSVAKERELD